MAGAIVGLHVFGADTGPEPLANLDTNYSALAAALNSLLTFANYYVDSGAVNAIVVTTAAGQTVTYTAGLMLLVTVGNTTTTTAPTINVNGMGGKTIQDANGNALLVGALVAGATYLFAYDGTVFRALSPMTGQAVQSGTFTLTATGMTTSPTNTIAWLQIGTYMLMTSTTTMSGTSNATSFTGTGVPPALQPTTTQTLPVTGFVDSGNAFRYGSITVQASNVLQFGIATVSGTQILNNLNGWTASGSKQFPGGISFNYRLI